MCSKRFAQGTQRPQNENKNLEARNPKFETNSTAGKNRIFQTSSIRFRFLEFGCFGLFRISIFGFRIFPVLARATPDAEGYDV
jgi:hypothetical protein